ncbi:MAG: SHOCT domain-containing protein [Actinomycetota bacterium]|nr:MAG: SHOCT domain-containing protein [Actinomycetota bacterium]
MSLLAAEFGTGEVLWSFLWFVMFFIWIWLLIVVFSDIFRSADLGGWAKGIWTVAIIVLPYLGVLIYLIVRGGKMHERTLAALKEQDAQAREYIQSVAGSRSPAEEIAHLAELRNSGVLSDAEFEAAKAKALA